jgi:hypothetical protein
MVFSLNVIQVLQKLIDHHLQDFSRESDERKILIKCLNELKCYPTHQRNRVPLMYSRREENQ